MAGSNGNANTGDMRGTLTLWLHLFFVGKETQGTGFLLENLQAASPCALGISLWPKDAQKLLALLCSKRDGEWQALGLLATCQFTSTLNKGISISLTNNFQEKSFLLLFSVLQTSHSQGDPVKSEAHWRQQEWPNGLNKISTSPFVCSKVELLVLLESFFFFLKTWSPYNFVFN